MSQPQRKSNFLGQILPFIIIFLAIQLFMSRNQAPADARTSDQILTTMRQQNQELKDQTIVSTNRDLDNKLSAEVQAKTLTQAEADKKHLEGVLLEADAQLRGGIKLKDIGRMEQAYQTIQQEWKSKHDTPVWDASTFPQAKGALSAPELYKTIEDTLNEANQKDQLYGFIPAWALIDALVRLTGAHPSFSYALAALILAVAVRAIIFPLSQKQLMWGRQMSQLAPLTREIKEKYKDQQEQGLKTMELYKEYGINPYAGCLPAIVQLPLFLTVYRCMLHYRFQFSAGTFLWISPAGNHFWPGFAQNLGMEDKTLIVIYGISMVISTLLTPVSDPNNAKQQRLMGVGMSLMFAVMMFFGLFPVPAAFVLYWVFTNMLATAQSLRAYRMPMPPLVKVNAATGGVYPVQKKQGFSDLMRQALEQKMNEAQQKKAEAEAKESPKDDIQNWIPANGKNANPSTLNGKAKSAAHKPKKRK